MTECIYEARNADGTRRANGGQQVAWCRTHGFFCPNTTPPQWKPTHVHADGGTYRFLHLCRIKMIDGTWHDGVVYETMSGVVYETMSGEICATHLTRWQDRFTEIK